MGRYPGRQRSRGRRHTTSFGGPADGSFSESDVPYRRSVEACGLSGVLDISWVDSTQLAIRYLHGQKELQLRARVKGVPIGSQTLVIVSLERKSRVGLSPLEVAEITRAEVEFMKGDPWV